MPHDRPERQASSAASEARAAARYVGGLALVVLAASSGCVTGSKLRADAQLIQQQVATARERGAYRCAPRELAKAESHLEFLLYELDEGDFRRAGWHHRNATQNVQRALEITDPNECAEKQVVIAETK